MRPGMNGGISWPWWIRISSGGFSDGYGIQRNFYLRPAYAACRRSTKHTRLFTVRRMYVTNRRKRISKLKGGHSNWRGPVWFPTSYLLISALKMFGEAYGPEFVVDLPPTSSERPLSPTDADRSTAIPPNSRKIPTGAIASCFMNTFTATTVPVWVQVTRRAGRGWWRL